MRADADTSFLVKLVIDEPGSEAAMAEFRRFDFPPLFFLPLHGLEVANAIRHRAFHLRRGAGSGQRAAIARERDGALARIERWLKRGWFTEAAADCDEALMRARTLSEKHTERLGCLDSTCCSPALVLSEYPADEELALLIVIPHSQRHAVRVARKALGRVASRRASARRLRARRTSKLLVLNKIT